jgi:hypothetical protein
VGMANKKKEVNQFNLFPAYEKAGIMMRRKP